MKEVSEYATFYCAIDDTRFFNKDECINYERNNSEKLIPIVIRDQTRLSREMCYYKQTKLPDLEKAINVFKNSIAKCSKAKEYTTLSVLYLELNDKIKERDNAVSKLASIREEINNNKTTLFNLKNCAFLKSHNSSIAQ